ncbi:FMRFamide receptor-like [Gigantopelta aegis]|uniref:FMRFamide receptor-like n=1 Tax=Gigantopelta aegis TaxID=1735272 RepID=UPI001B8889F9|nr:FMRFamide receptor-like [Gigantopelta aegis]
MSTMTSEGEAYLVGMLSSNFNVAITVPAAPSQPSNDTITPQALVLTRFVVQTILVPIVVTIGLLGNVLNIVVLSHPKMRTSTNVYIMVLALADTFYLVFSFALSFARCSNLDQSYAAFQFVPYGRVISDTAGNTAVWITVIFTIERYVAVCHPMKGKAWCTVTKARVASFLALVFCTANTIPELFELTIRMSSDGSWRCKKTDMARSTSYQIGYNWWYVTLFTIVPFVFLIIFNSQLIRSLLRAKKKRQVLLQNNSGNVKNSREENKVTLMLVTIVIIFLVCQLPWTVLLLYRSYLDDNGYYVPVTEIKIAGNICNLLVQINASVNFYLYSFFSRKFRKTFTNIFCFIATSTEQTSFV